MDLDKDREGIEKRFFELCSKVTKDEDLTLYDMEYITGQSLLRVYILDEKTGSATLDDCVRVDKAMTPFLEDESWIPESLTLEVSSPGVYRSLKRREHFERAVGEKIKLVTKARVNGKNKFVATLSNVDQDGLNIKIKDNEIHINFNEIKKANLELTV